MEGVIGEIRGFGGNFAPRNWALCNGQLLSIAQNSALFSILGTTYGGDGRTTFALPDLRGRAPISAGTGPGLSPHKLGARSGTETVTLNVLQMPSHNHIASFTSTGSAGTPAKVEVSTANGAKRDAAAGDYLAKATQGPSGNNIYVTNPDASTLVELGGVSGGGGVVTGTVAVGLTGGSQFHNNMSPYLVINWVICLQGIFPSRS